MCSVVIDADLPKPELLPCGYIVGEVNSISLELKGIPCLCVLVDTVSWRQMQLIQELIRRWDSERELFLRDIVHVDASAYAHW